MPLPRHHVVHSTSSAAHTPSCSLISDALCGVLTCIVLHNKHAISISICRAKERSRSQPTRAEVKRWVR